MGNEKKEQNIDPTIDTTRIINISEREFTWNLNNQPYTLKAGEERTFPVWVARLLAKHLVNEILQKDHSIRATLHTDPLRDDLLAKILPDAAEDAGVEPREKEDFLAEVKKRLEDQEKQIAALGGQKDESQDEIKSLRGEIKAMKMRLGKLNKNK